MGAVSCRADMRHSPKEPQKWHKKRNGVRSGGRKNGKESCFPSSADGGATAGRFFTEFPPFLGSSMGKVRISEIDYAALLGLLSRKRVKTNGGGKSAETLGFPAAAPNRPHGGPWTSAGPILEPRKNPNFQAEFTPLSRPPFGVGPGFVDSAHRISSPRFTDQP